MPRELPLLPERICFSPADDFLDGERRAARISEPDGNTLQPVARRK
jgi:hypothetical protein